MFWNYFFVAASNFNVAPNPQNLTFSKWKQIKIPLVCIKEIIA